MNNSNLPRSIKNDDHSLAPVGSSLYVKEGPKSPMAGPTLPSDAADTPSEETKSKPKNAKTSDPKANNSMYKIKKAAILYTIL